MIGRLKTWLALQDDLPNKVLTMFLCEDSGASCELLISNAEELCIAHTHDLQVMPSVKTAPVLNCIKILKENHHTCSSSELGVWGHQYCSKLLGRCAKLTGGWPKGSFARMQKIKAHEQEIWQEFFFRVRDF